MLGKVRTLLEWPDELLSKMLEWTGVEWMDTPWTVRTTRAPTVLKNIHRNLGRGWWLRRISSQVQWNSCLHLGHIERPRWRLEWGFYPLRHYQSVLSIKWSYVYINQYFSLLSETFKSGFQMLQIRWTQETTHRKWCAMTSKSEM